MVGALRRCRDFEAVTIRHVLDGFDTGIGVFGGVIVGEGARVCEGGGRDGWQC